MDNPASPQGVLDRSHQYCNREEILSLLHAGRPRSPPTRNSRSHSHTHSRTGSSLTGASSSSSAGLGSSHPLSSITRVELHDSVFVDVSEGAMVELQRLLRAMPNLAILNAAKSNITGRIFYQGRSFRVDDPEKEHVSVEAVQAQSDSNKSKDNSSMATNATGGTEGPNAAAASASRSIVRDDHPPLIIALKREHDLEDDDDNDDESDSEDSEGSGSSSGSGSSDSESETSSDDGETNEGAAHRRRKRERRRRRRIEPEIVDLEETPLAELLSRQQSAPALPRHLSASSSSSSSSSSSASAVAPPPTHNYYFYVRTLYNPDDNSFLRYYVKLNWLRRVYWINMSGTSISGYGCTSLMASYCSQIQFLFLSECAHLDNNGVVSIVNLTTQLRRLDISHCPKINRFGLLFLAEFNLHVLQNCLEWMDVSHCGANQVSGMAAGGEMAESGFLHTPSPQPHSTSAPPPLSATTAAQSSPASQQSTQLVCVALFNSLEERGFKGTLVWQKYPRKEELVGQPQVIQVQIPPTLHPQAAAMPDAGNLFAPPMPRYQLQLSSAFLQHYQSRPDRIIDLAMRDITDQVLTVVPWSWIKQQDAQRAARLARHHLQLGAQPNISNFEGAAASSSMDEAAAVPAHGFVSAIEAEMEQAELARMFHEHGLRSLPVGYEVPAPHFYSLNLSGHLINDRLLFYILINWGPRLYSLTLDGIYITSAGLRELQHCPNLHLLSICDCLNLINKTQANAILKDSLKMMLFLSEINLTHSRLSGRMMSSHPNLKLEVLIANGCPISSFAIRMLASSSSSAPAQPQLSSADAGVQVAVPPPPAPQNMCKYSMRVLCLSGCAFINRKAVEYMFKFAYLSLLDVSECKGLRASELMDAFRSQAEAEIKALESVVQPGKRSSSKAPKAAPPAPTSFATLMCSLKHLICFGLSGAGMTDKRAMEFARDLNQYGAKLQHLLVQQYYQQQAQREMDSSQKLAADASHNLAPPLALRSSPPSTPAWLRRDFVSDPILIIAQRSSPHLRHFQPTLTRFIAQQQTNAQGETVRSLLTVPAGIDAAAAAAGGVAIPNGGSVTPPPLFRGSSLLEDCPYTYLPQPVPAANPQPAAHVNPAHATPASHVPVTPSRQTATSASAPPAAQQPSFPLPPFHLPSPLPHSNSYMMMHEEQAGGGNSTAANSTLSPATAHARGPSQGRPQAQHAQPTAPSQTLWPGLPVSSMPHSASVPVAGGGGAELYSLMQSTSVQTQQPRSTAASTPQSARPASSASTLVTGGEEGQPTTRAHALSTSSSSPSPLPHVANLSLSGVPAPAPRPTPVAATSAASMLQAYSSVPHAAAVSPATLAFPSVGLVLPPTTSPPAHASIHGSIHAPLAAIPGSTIAPGVAIGQRAATMPIGHTGTYAFAGGSAAVLPTPVAAPPAAAPAAAATAASAAASTPNFWSTIGPPLAIPAARKPVGGGAPSPAVPAGTFVSPFASLPLAPTAVGTAARAFASPFASTQQQQPQSVPPPSASLFAVVSSSSSPEGSRPLISVLPMPLTATPAASADAVAALSTSAPPAGSSLHVATPSASGQASPLQPGLAMAAGARMAGTPEPASAPAASSASSSAPSPAPSGVAAYAAVASSPADFTPPPPLIANDASLMHQLFPPSLHPR